MARGRHHKHLLSVPHLNRAIIRNIRHFVFNVKLMSYICLFPMLPADRNTKDEEKVGGWARERVSRQASMLTSLPGFGKPRQRLAVPRVRFQEFVCGTNDFDERRECR